MFDESPYYRHGEHARALPGSTPAEETLLHRFNRHFRTVPADTSELIQRAQEIRYQVYCIERQFEDPDDHADHREKDKFDTHSVHSLLIHQATGYAVGTVRLVLPRDDAPDDSLAIQRVVDPSMLASSVPIRETAEVSRFSISKRFWDFCAETYYASDANLAGQRQIGPLMRPASYRA